MRTLRPKPRGIALGLEFAVDGYQDTIDDLPVVINRIDRRRESVSRAVRAFAWKPQPREEPDQ